jgi:hypothetical protein
VLFTQPTKEEKMNADIPLEKEIADALAKYNGPRVCSNLIPVSDRTRRARPSERLGTTQRHFFVVDDKNYLFNVNDYAKGRPIESVKPSKAGNAMRAWLAVQDWQTRKVK